MEKSKDYFFINSGKELSVKVEFSNVLFIVGDKDYVLIHTKNNKYQILKTLKSMQEFLPDNFYRCHRSYIVNLDAIEFIEGTSSDGSTKIKDIIIPISERNWKEMRELLNHM